MFCNSCGEALGDNKRNCAFCGELVVALDRSSEGLVFIAGSDRRELYGSIRMADASEDIWVEPDSIQARTARQPFDATVPPVSGDLVPGNCVWVALRHPGPVAQGFSRLSLEEKFADPYWPQARHISEIIQILGEPLSMKGDADGGFIMRVWTESKGLFGRKVAMVGIWFDSYGVAAQTELDPSKHFHN